MPIQTKYSSFLSLDLHHSYKFLPEVPMQFLIVELVHLYVNFVFLMTSDAGHNFYRFTDYFVFIEWLMAFIVIFIMLDQ